MSVESLTIKNMMNLSKEEEDEDEIRKITS